MLKKQPQGVQESHMKKVLITGLNSYIGNSFEKYIENMLDPAIQTKKVSLKDEDWQEKSWAEYDAVLHVAGLAHVDVSRADEKTRQRYYHINRDLAGKAAEKAKKDGVRQFIYLSSVIVYGDSAPIGKEKKITRETKPSPANFYGDSKLQGEQAVLASQKGDGSEGVQDTFHVLVLRLPMIYGKDSRGNFPKLKKLAERTPVFPKIENRRSMLYIGNLCELIRIAIEGEWEGIICPQNREIVSTSELVRIIGEQRQKKIILVPGFSGILKLCSHFTGYVNKIFGSLEYDRELDASEAEYCRYSLQESLAEIFLER